MAGFNLNTFKNFNIGKIPMEQSVQQVVSPAVSTPADSKEEKSKTEVKPAQKEQTIKVSPIKDEFLKAKSSRGLFEKVYDFTKNATGFGHGYKKLEQAIENAEQNKISEADLKNSVDKYKRSNENARQTFGDVTSGLVSLFTYFGLTNQAKKLNARYELNAFGERAKEIFSSSKLKFIENIVKSKARTLAIVIPIAAIAGGFMKYFTLKINRIGSKEFDYGNKKELGKEKYKEQKAIIKGQKRLDSCKNFFTGMLNGIYAPLAALGGGIVGAPAYLLATTGTRYAMSKKEDKSLGDFGKDLADNAVFNTLAAAAIAVPAFRKGKYQKVLTKNIATVVQNLKDKTLIIEGGTETTINKLGGKLAKSPEIDSILKDSSLSVEQQIQKLSDENIFFVKIKQISARGDDLTLALREKCPATRNLSEAATEIQTALGNTGYEVKKCLGVGTIAESYLVKTPDGKEVVAKIIKKGITKEKILADKQKLINLVTSGAAESALTEEQKYFVRNIDNLADSVLAEVNLQNEANAARELAKVTKKANVVKPIEYKNGVYLMEKAEGISLGNLAEYCKAKQMLTPEGRQWAWYRMPENVCKELEKKGLLSSEERMAAAEKYANDVIAKVKNTSPDFADFDISVKELRKLLSDYANVQTEQFVKLDRNGKIIHGDIHPGNIFIDINVLKGKKKGKLFTLIDTGNTIKMDKEQAKDALRLTAFMKNGNYKDLARMVTQDAILPPGLTREQAREFVENKLKMYFTDNTHGIPSMTLENLNALTDAIFMEKGIISGNSQLALAKAKQSAKNSLLDLLKSFFEKKFANAEDNPLNVAVALKDGGSLLAEFKSKNRLREWFNLLQMSPSEVWKFLRNKNMLPSNGVEYLTYSLKQGMSKTPKDFIQDIIKKYKTTTSPETIFEEIRKLNLSDNAKAEIMQALTRGDIDLI